MLKEMRLYKMKMLLIGLILFLYGSLCFTLEIKKTYVIKGDTVIFGGKSLSFGEGFDSIEEQFTKAEYEIGAYPLGMGYFFSDEVLLATIDLVTNTIDYFHFFLNDIPSYYDLAPSKLTYSEIMVDGLTFHSNMKKEDVIRILEESKIHYSVQERYSRKIVVILRSNGNRLVINFIEDRDNKISSLELDYGHQEQ